MVLTEGKGKGKGKGKCQGKGKGIVWYSIVASEALFVNKVRTTPDRNLYETSALLDLLRNGATHQMRWPLLRHVSMAW